MAAQAFPVQYAAEKEIRIGKGRRGLTVVEHNRELFDAQRARRRGPTLEIPFPKHLDNTRLVKSSDRRRVREMRSFALATFFLFFLLTVYVFQHFNAIENGYKVESQKKQVESLLEDNRHLRRDEAELTDPQRIGVEAELLGMTPPQPGQVVLQDGIEASGNSQVLALADAPKLNR
jgi:hypothetical protein